MKKIDKDQVVKGIDRANPWWRGESVGYFKELPRRTHFDRLYRLVRQTDPKRAVVLMGPRRIGKTVLVYQLVDQLIKDGTNPKSIVYLSLHNPIFRLSTLEELLLLATEWAGVAPKGVTMFFDEIQYLDTWEQQLKALVDSYPDTKFFVTGSAAAALHKKSKESGAGRFTDYLLPPLSFYEFVFIKGEIEKTPRESIDLAKLNSLYLEYLNYGGFPESITSENVRNKPEQYIGEDILDKVLGRDLPSIYGISNPNELHRLFAALAYNTSNEVSPDSISKEAGVSKNDINKYIDFLESAFLIRVIDKTDDHIKKFQRRTHFKIVLTNPSLRSAIFGKLSAEDKDLEGLAETAVFSQLIIHQGRYPSYKYARWNRGGSKGEVDLVHVTLKGDVTAALEIKWSDRFAEGSEKPRSLISFCKDNELPVAFMTSKTVFSTTNHSSVIVKHIPTSYLCFVIGFFGGMMDSAGHSRKTGEAASLSENDVKSKSQEMVKHAVAVTLLKGELLDKLQVAVEAVLSLLGRTVFIESPPSSDATPPTK